MRAFPLVLLALTAAMLTGTALAQSAGGTPPREDRFVHHVFFWLKNPDSSADKAKLIAGLRGLTAIDTIRRWQIGEPAATRRGVIDSSYSVSWTLMFDSAADQQAYQVDPIHLNFVEENAALWERVTVYDTEPAAD